MKIYPVITLYQPWATWIMRGWKTIETRTHNRFSSLLGKQVLIHAGQKTDESAVNNPYLTPEQIRHNPDEIVNGFILGSAYVKNFGLLSEIHEQKALIECRTQRFGLYLKDINKFETPIPVKGEMGIWYYDLENLIKVKKPTNQLQYSIPMTPEQLERIYPHPECPDCNGSGVVQVGTDQYVDCPCLSPDPHESVCPKCGSVMGMVTMGEWRCFGKGCWK